MLIQFPFIVLHKREIELANLEKQLKQAKKMKPLPELKIDPEWIINKFENLEKILNDNILSAREKIRNLTTEITLLPITQGDIKYYRASGMGKLGNILGLYSENYILQHSGGRI